MKTQVAKVCFHGTYRIIHDDTKKCNPYRITLNGKKVVDYQDYASCLWHLVQLLSENH